MAAISGMGGSVTYNAIVYPVKDWSVTLACSLEEITSTDSNGWAEFLPCVKSGDASFNAVEGKGGADFAGGIPPGASASVIFPLGISDTAYTGTFLIGSSGIKNDCKLPVEFSCSGKFTGAVTFGDVS